MHPRDDSVGQDAVWLSAGRVALVDCLVLKVDPRAASGYARIRGGAGD